LQSFGLMKVTSRNHNVKRSSDYKKKLTWYCDAEKDEKELAFFFSDHYIAKR